VVLEQHHVVAQLGHAADLAQASQDSLAGLVCWMRLAGKDDLHWTLGIGQQTLGTLEILEQQIRAFVDREASRKANREHRGAELGQRLWIPEALALSGETPLDEAEQALFEHDLGVPELELVEILDLAPAVGIA